MDKLKRISGGNAAGVVDIYDSISDYLVTSVDFTSLITELMDYDFSQEMISATENTQAGETVNTEDLEKSSETVKIQNTESKVDTGEKNTEELEVVPDFDTEEKEKDTESKDKKNNKKDKVSDSKKDQKDEKIVLEVKRGDVCRIIAENLATLGMVEDAENFRKYMQKNGYDHQINVGTFELKKGMSYEEIAKTITS